MINIISRSVGRCKSLHSEVARHTHRVAVIKSTAETSTDTDGGNWKLHPLLAGI